MARDALYTAARKYIAVIEAIEKTKDKEKLLVLEEQRVIWHNRFMETLRQEGIPFKDRDHATRIAYRIVDGEL